MRAFRYLFIIAASILGFSSCNQSETEKSRYSELRRENINGNVASMRTTAYECDSTGKPGEENECCSTLFEYDEKGNLVKSVSTDKTGKIVGEEHATTHSSGLQQTLTSFEDGKKTRFMEMIINDSGQYTAGKMFDGEGKLTMHYEEVKQNEYGQPVYLVLYDNNDSLIFKELSTYRGNFLLTTKRVDKDGIELSSAKLTYNDKGNLVSEESYSNEEGQIVKSIEKITYTEFDKRDNWTLRTHWDENGKALKIMKRVLVYR